MKRTELEDHVAQAIQNHKPYVFLEMEGDPNATKQRLIGHRKGPYGYVVGYNGPRSMYNIVMFDSARLQAYLDYLPLAEFSGHDEMPLHISTDKTVEQTYEKKGRK